MDASRCARITPRVFVCMCVCVTRTQRLHTDSRFSLPERARARVHVAELMTVLATSYTTTTRCGVVIVDSRLYHLYRKIDGDETLHNTIHKGVARAGDATSRRAPGISLFSDGREVVVREVKKGGENSRLADEVARRYPIIAQFSRYSAQLLLKCDGSRARARELMKRFYDLQNGVTALCENYTYPVYFRSVVSSLDSRRSIGRRCLPEMFFLSLS